MNQGTGDLGMYLAASKSRNCTKVGYKSLASWGPVFGHWMS